MPYKPAFPCRWPGCPSLTHDGYCPAHKKHKDKEHDQRRGTAASRGYDARHRRWRKAILARDPICVICDVAPATIADHIKPLSEGGTWHYSNGQGLCHTCHNRKTTEDQKRKQARVGQ